MSPSVDIFNIIASDIGIKRFAGEEDDSFCSRTAYSAARFWLLAFCMDDGASGDKGITKQVMNRKLKSWISSLDKIRPGLDSWFIADDKGIQAVYNRLIDIGDLAPKGFSDCYIATVPEKIELSESLSCITGYYDPTANNSDFCVADMNSLLLSGLLSIIQSKNGIILHPDSWWKRDIEYISWEKMSNYDEVKFADVNTSRWNIKNSDVWTESCLWVNGLALARVDSNGADSIVFIANRVRGRVRLSKITWIQAQELFFYLRQESGNRAIARFVVLDDLHAKAILPIGFVPGHINRILDAIGWPIENADDRFNRIIRMETLQLIEELLSASYIGFKGASDG